MLSFPFPDVQILGAGVVTPPPMTEKDLAEIWGRAHREQNQQHRTDLFRLLTAVEAKTNAFDSFAKEKK